MGKFKIANTVISKTSPTYFIADVAANHNGDLVKAKELIHMVAENGGDAAKFQNFQAPKTVNNRLQYLGLILILAFTAACQNSPNYSKQNTFQVVPKNAAVIAEGKSLKTLRTLVSQHNIAALFQNSTRSQNFQKAFEKLNTTLETQHFNFFGSCHSICKMNIYSGIGFKTFC